MSERFLIVVPGVRSVKNREDDQKRIVDVKEAFLNGADYVVVGRPIYQAPDPIDTVRRMQAQIKEVLEATA